MTTTVELRVSYFNSISCKSVEYTKEYDYKDLEEAQRNVAGLIISAEFDADADGCMPGTFYWEYDFLVPADEYKGPAL